MQFNVHDFSVDHFNPIIIIKLYQSLLSIPANRLHLKRIFNFQRKTRNRHQNCSSFFPSAVC